jgi:hypothetical protein
MFITKLPPSLKYVPPHLAIKRLGVVKTRYLAVVPPDPTPEQTTAPFTTILVTAGGGGAPVKATYQPKCNRDKDLVQTWTSQCWP